MNTCDKCEAPATWTVRPPAIRTSTVVAFYCDDHLPAGQPPSTEDGYLWLVLPLESKP